MIVPSTTTLATLINQLNCQVCLDSFVVKEGANELSDPIITKCGHSFHEACLASLSTCPTCRHVISDKWRQGGHKSYLLNTVLQALRELAVSGVAAESPRPPANPLMSVGEMPQEAERLIGGFKTNAATHYATGCQIKLDQYTAEEAIKLQRELEINGYVVTIQDEGQALGVCWKAATVGEAKACREIAAKNLSKDLLAEIQSGIIDALCPMEDTSDFVPYHATYTLSKKWEKFTDSFVAVLIQAGFTVNVLDQIVNGYPLRQLSIGFSSSTTGIAGEWTAASDQLLYNHIIKACDRSADTLLEYEASVALPSDLCFAAIQRVLDRLSKEGFRSFHRDFQSLEVHWLDANSGLALTYKERSDRAISQRCKQYVTEILNSVMEKAKHPFTERKVLMLWNDQSTKVRKAFIEALVALGFGVEESYCNMIRIGWSNDADGHARRAWEMSQQADAQAVNDSFGTQFPASPSNPYACTVKLPLSSEYAGDIPQIKQAYLLEGFSVEGITSENNLIIIYINWENATTGRAADWKAKTDAMMGVELVYDDVENSDSEQKATNTVRQARLVGNRKTITTPARNSLRRIE